MQVYTTLFFNFSVCLQFFLNKMLKKKIQKKHMVVTENLQKTEKCKDKNQCGFKPFLVPSLMVSFLYKYLSLGKSPSQCSPFSNPVTTRSYFPVLASFLGSSLNIFMALFNSGCYIFINQRPK